MKRILTDLWTDDCGALLATEWVVVATLVVLGVIPGLVAIRNGVLNEIKDVSNATTALDQSYDFAGNELVGHHGDRTRGDSASHRPVGNGSVTDIVKVGNNHTVTKTTTTTGHDRRDSSWNGNRMARSGGSGFIQGNHTADGHDLHTGVRSVDIRKLEKRAKSPAETDTPADVDE